MSGRDVADDDPLALSDDDDVRIGVSVVPAAATRTAIRAALRGGSGDDEKARRRTAAGGIDEKTANEGGNAEDDSLLRGSTAAAGGAGGAGGGGGGNGHPVISSSGDDLTHTVKELLLIHEHQQKLDAGYKLGRFLTFENAELERTYHHWFGLLQEHKIRLRLLAINFLIMLYSVVEWFSAELTHPEYLVATRVIYMAVNVSLFILSLIYRDAYRDYLQSFCTILISFTSALILFEGYLLNIIYSPIVVLILLVYVMTAAAFVRVRFINWLFCSTGTFLVYDILALTKVVHGDSVARPSELAQYLVVYNILFIFATICIVTISRKNENMSRLAFVQCTRIQRGEGGAGVAPGSVAASIVAAAAGGGGAHALAPDGPNSEAHSASNLATLMERNRFQNLWAYLNDLERRRGGAGVAGGDAAAVAESPARPAQPVGPRRPRLADRDDPEMPEWMHPAAYVQTGYRLHYSNSDALRSVFEMHNETVNVWTEFGPMILFVIAWITISFTDPAFRNAGLVDRGLIHAAIAMAFVIRPALSGFAHLMHCVDEKAYVTWWAIDYGSIVFTILFGSFVFGRFTFYCLGQQELFFLLSVTFLSLSTMAAVIWITNSAVRIGSFFLYVLFANAVPFFYSVYLKFQISATGQYDIPDKYLGYWVGMLVFVGVGFVIKATFIPERFLSRGRVDNIGASHQIWHVLINTGNAMSVVAWHYYLTWRESHPCSGIGAKF